MAKIRWKMKDIILVTSDQFFYKKWNQIKNITTNASQPSYSNLIVNFFCLAQLSSLLENLPGNMVSEATIVMEMGTMAWNIATHSWWWPNLLFTGIWRFWLQWCTCKNALLLNTNWKTLHLSWFCLAKKMKDFAM